MASFQTIVLIIAVIILILCLTGVGVAIYFNRYSTVFPPISSTCPDGYTASSSSSSSDTFCTINSDQETSSNSRDCKRININQANYNGTAGLCQKYIWATQCGVNWQGVTEESNNQCPSNS